MVWREPQPCLCVRRFRWRPFGSGRSVPPKTPFPGHSSYLHGGAPPFHIKSICIGQVTLRPYVVQTWSHDGRNFGPTKPSYSTEWNGDAPLPRLWTKAVTATSLDEGGGGYQLVAAALVAVVGRAAAAFHRVGGFGRVGCRIGRDSGVEPSLFCLTELCGAQPQTRGLRV